MSPDKIFVDFLFAFKSAPLPGIEDSFFALLQSKFSGKFAFALEPINLLITESCNKL